MIKISPRDYPEIMTPEQAAEYLQVVLRTVYRLIERGDLKAAKVGRVWRIRKSDVDSYINGLIERNTLAEDTDKE